MRRRDFIKVIAGGATATWPLAARAQQGGKERRIGVLTLYEETNPEVQGWLTAFREALGKLGWTEGQSIKFEYHWVGIDPSLIQQAAKDVVTSRPDLIISPSSPTTASLLQQTRTIPIVFVQVVDPVGQGFVVSLSRPGGNATGLVNLETSMAGKWLELLKEVMPSLRRVVIPFNPATTPYADLYLQYFKSAAPSVDVAVTAAPVEDFAALEAIAGAQAREPNTGFVLMPSGFISGRTKEIAAIMARYSLPAIYSIRSFPEAGGLMSYGNDITDNYRRAAAFVDRILRGDTPSELPVQFPVKFELVVNLKTAKALGLEIPPKVLALADEAIE